MELFWQAVACALIAVILCAVLSSRGKDFSLLLGLTVCAMVLLGAVHLLKPVIELIETLKDAGQLDDDLLQTVLKAVGIGLIGELAAQICSDAGSSALGKAVETLTAAAILWLSIPLMTMLLELVQQMAGAV